MINYIEKGRGLHDKIKSLGYTLENVDGVWVADNPTVVQALIDDYTLDEAKKFAINQIDLYAKQYRDRVMEAISPAEMASWPIKREEAMAFLATGDSNTAPNLGIEAASRGMSLDQLVELVMYKAHVFASMESQVAGKTGYHQDRVRACTSFEELIAYDWTLGWPEF